MIIMSTTSIISLIKTKFFSPQSLILLGLLAGIVTGFYGEPILLDSAQRLSEIYVKFLKLVSTPLIFLSICSTLSSIKGVGEIKKLGGKVLGYTVTTTLIAAAIGLLAFLIFQPTLSLETIRPVQLAALPSESYTTFIMGIFPSNIVEAFRTNNVIAIMIIAFLMGLATLSLEESKKSFLQNLFSSLFEMAIKMTEFILKFIPLAIWAFVTLFIKDQKGGLDLGPLSLYFTTVIGANLIQAFVVLPLLLKFKGYNPLKVAKGFAPALSLAFFSKSSNAALPTTLKCAQQNLGFSKKVSNFSLPLCVTCNMNACAAFILITVLFVAHSHGVSFTAIELFVWVILATLAAIGNAGVPMGCYFLATAFLTAMDLPLTIMGLILPLYALLDMVETAVNVWSDGVITAVVEKDLRESSPVKTAAVKAHSG